MRIGVALVLAALPFAPAQRPTAVSNAADLVAAMQKRYAATWYKTATFVQKTTTFSPDGSSKVATWYEAISIPGKLRIDYAPESDGNGILFADGQIFTFKSGKLDSSRPYVHPLLLLGFDVYRLPAETVLKQLGDLKFDLSAFHPDTWQGRPAYVVGAASGDLQSPQFWIDSERLYFVRMLRPAANGATQETQFNKYQRLGGGWMSPEVVFKTGDRIATTEEYSELRADVTLDSRLFDPQSWTAVHWHGAPAPIRRPEGRLLH